jgi:hypothetical protein
MDQLCGWLLVTGWYPLYRAWRGTQGTTLRHAIVWTSLTWGVFCVSWLTGGGRELRYLALCLAGVAGIAVLGARRPGVAAWNVVLVGLLLALIRPYWQGLGEMRLELAHLAFLATVLLVGAGNFLPTRSGIAAGAFLVWSVVEMGVLGGLVNVEHRVLPLILAVVPWLWLAPWRRGARSVHEIDHEWRTFRDAFGFLWAQRQREQFNRAAANAGLTVVMGWRGLRGPESEHEKAMALLRAVLQRFGDDPTNGAA